MNFQPISPKWNIIDSGIYTMEKFIKKGVDLLIESRSKEPDVEEMIAIETEHLRSENEEYKKMQYPTKLRVFEEKEFCPKCGREIPENYEGKCCFECGQRISKARNKKV